ncbi:unnamed protein product [Rotaria magnacalcarata]|uniref:Serpin domain-containing protein n=2 Tax=Rotaria magnacalcarata TaxID=392030 RepID=A0A815LNN4_9BILA|nr:unnamed protein product [Rotaria magnacalcarata]CAF1411839.1 unnamed protein product [Rotaria magnacalcarata]CAF4519943.1 unnamed protein product [Rotaria magnacalcarata]CAF5022669.1 unnamed protein product [Rotaria magnacalcarata]
MSIGKFRSVAFVLLFDLGSEAAAATAVIMNRCSASIARKVSPIEFKVDRPFLFFIRETKQDLVLFHGKYVSPPAAS